MTLTACWHSLKNHNRDCKSIPQRLSFTNLQSNLQITLNFGNSVHLKINYYAYNNFYQNFSFICAFSIKIIPLDNLLYLTCVFSCIIIVCGSMTDSCSCVVNDFSPYLAVDCSMSFFAFSKMGPAPLASRLSAKSHPNLSPNANHSSSDCST